MGMNYYAYMMPKVEDKYKLLKAIMNDNPIEIEEYYIDIIKNNTIHLGKKSVGWKFIWNPNYVVKFDEINFPYYTPDKESITHFLLSNTSFIGIFDETGRYIFTRDFLDMAYNSEGITTTEYYKKNPNLNILDSYTKKILDKISKSIANPIDFSIGNNEFFNDGLVFSSNTEFC